MAVTEEARVLALVDAIYRAALDDDLGRRLADTIAAGFESPSCLVYFARRDAANPSAMPETSAILSGTQEFNDRTCSAYAEYYHDRNEWYGRAWNRPAPYVVFGEELIPTRDVLRTEWSDFLQMTRTLYVLGTQFDVGPDLIGIIGVHRAPRERPFDESDRRRMQLLLPHVQRALELRERLSMAERRAGFAVEALGDLAVGVVVVLADGAVVYVNRVAERAMTLGVGLSVRAGRAVPASVQQAEELAAAVRTACRPGEHGEPPKSATLTIRGRQGGVLPILVVPLPAESVRFGSNAPAAALVFSDPRQAQPAYPDALAKQFGLTRSESALLQALLRGREVTDYAQAAGIGVGTARTHLKQVFLKTGQHRQSDLVRLALEDPMSRLWRASGAVRR